MPDSTLIRLHGRDALDLLHRISTQQLRELPPGHGRTTLFCDFRGRILHRAAVVHGAGGAVWLLRHDAPADELLALVDAQVFRDDVRLEDWSAKAKVAAALAGATSVAGALSERDGLPARLGLGGVDLVVGVGGDAPLALDETARIAFGFPRHGHEIRDDFNPYEVGLARDLHLDKGCFTGQEALLRMVTYRGVRRRLVRLEGNGVAPAANETLKRGPDDAGVVTSVATSGARWTALAVMRRDAVGADALVGASGATVERVTPFEETRPAGLPDSTAAAG